MGRIGCPVCGHDEHFRTKYDCGECNGTGKIINPEYAEVIKEMEVEG